MKDRIKEIRKESKMTQEDFSLRIGTARNTIATYETGIRTPSNSVIMSICKEFNVNEKWLRYGTGDKYNITNTDFSNIMCSIDRSDLRAKQAILYYWSLSVSEKEKLWYFIDTFVMKK